MPNVTQGERELQDARIMSKVNAAHRAAFHEKFPGQIEHCLRLTAERLQAVLSKRADLNPADIDTWPATPGEIKDLALALTCLQEVYKNL